MHQVLAIARKDMLQWMRRPLYFIASVTLAVLIIWCVGDTISGATNISLGLYDPAGMSDLTQHLKDSRRFQVSSYEDIDRAKEDLVAGKIAVLTAVSQDPLEDQVAILTEGHNLLIDQQIAMGILSVLTRESKRLELPLQSASLFSAPYNVRDYVTPGLMAYMCYVLSSMNLGFAWIYEWWEKTYRQIILAPNGLRAAIASKTLTVTLQASVVLWLAVCITAPIAGFTLGNNFAGMVAFTLLSTFCFTCVGLCFACLLKTIRVYTMTVSILGVALMFASGVVIPVEAMPDWERNLAQLLPMYYIADAFRGVILGMPADYGTDVLVLVSWSGLAIMLAAMLLSRRRATL